MPITPTGAAAILGLNGPIADVPEGWTEPVPIPAEAQTETPPDVPIVQPVAAEIAKPPSETMHPEEKASKLNTWLGPLIASLVLHHPTSPSLRGLVLAKLKHFGEGKPAWIPEDIEPVKIKDYIIDNYSPPVPVAQQAPQPGQNRPRTVRVTWLESMSGRAIYNGTNSLRTNLVISQELINRAIAEVGTDADAVFEWLTEHLQAIVYRNGGEIYNTSYDEYFDHEDQELNNRSNFSIPGLYEIIDSFLGTLPETDRHIHPDEEEPEEANWDDDHHDEDEEEPEEIDEDEEEPEEIDEDEEEEPEEIDEHLDDNDP